jgi:tRNA_anti-like
MEDCSIDASAPAGGNTPNPGPIVAGSADVLSANALYRAFQGNEVDAINRYVGRAVSLEGLRGDVILMSDGVKAVVHIADRGKSNALILQFSDRNPLRGIERGQRFRFRCTVEMYEYLIVWMEDCSIER